MGTNGMNLEVNAVRGERNSSATGLSAEPAPANAPARILPVDPGFGIESHMYMRQVKGEDIAFSYRADSSLLGRPMPSTQTGSPEDWKLNFDVFVLCDGHSGSQANMFVREEFLRLLEPQMPRALPASFSHTAGAVYASTVRTAVSNTLDALNERFCEDYERSGCTCTVAVYTGALLTVANIGDSDAVLDTFSDSITMTVAHRINDNEAEKSRLLATGAEIAPLSQEMDGPARVGTLGLGPLRIWPGGLCVSRSIGDKDVGPEIIGTPHIRQVLVPEWGCRLIMASDGVWDCISKSVVVSTCKGKACGAAATNIVNKCVRVRQGALADDTTCVVIDSKPHNVATFKGYTPDLTKREGSTSVKGATGPVLPGETSMDGYADGAPNQISAPLKNGALSSGGLQDSSHGIFMPNGSIDCSPRKGMAQNCSLESLTGAGNNNHNKLSTIVSNVSDGGDDAVSATHLSTVGEGESASRENGTTQATYISGKPVGGDVGAGGVQPMKRKSKSGIFSCCFAPSDTDDQEERLRMSMLNDHTHHAGTINHDVPKGAGGSTPGLKRADTSQKSLGASSDTQHGAPKATDPSSHSGIGSEGSRSGAGMRRITSVAGSINFLRRRRSAAPLVMLFADVDMITLPKPEDFSGGPGGPAGLLNAPASSLILRSTSTADEAAQMGVHSPDTPPSGTSAPGVSLTGGNIGNAPEGRLRGGRPRHQLNASNAPQHPHQLSSSVPSPPSVFLPQASEIGVAGSAWGTPVQVSHSQGRSAAPGARRKASSAKPEAGNMLDSPDSAAAFGMAFRAAHGDGGHSARSGEGVSAQSVPSTPGLPIILKRPGSPELDMGIMPPASPLVRNQRETRASSKGW